MMSSCLHECVAAQAARTPDAFAVSSDTVRLTYRQLDDRANRLAHRLAGLGVGPDVPVALLMERSAEVIVGMLGILKAGGCYVPLHDSYPLERMQWIVDHVGAPVLVADEAMARRGLPRGGPIVIVGTEAAEPSTEPCAGAGPDDLAYVMHTSGSTGHPKGVAVTHRSALTVALDPGWDAERHRRVLLAAPYAFGVSLYEIWVPLLRGGEIVVAPPGPPTVATLRRLIATYGVTGVQLAAGLFRVVADEEPGCLTGVREVITGGDTIAPTAVERLLEACPDLVVRAMYGSTELTVFATGVPLAAPYRAGASVPVGRPLGGARIYLLDERLEPVPTGEVGELFVGGPGVARGYLGQPGMTAERFVADPFEGGGRRMFRTGDLARWTADGLLDFVGRVDNQVKIRGFRVELAEVEAAVGRHPDVAHAVVTAPELEPGDRRLVAYVVPRVEACDARELRAHAAARLPDYMVPSAFVPLDALPVTPNGKVDREALPDPGPADVAYRPPRNAMEKTLCSIFADVLGVSDVGIDDSFFDLGGQSLLAVRIANRIKAEFDVELTVEQFFDAATVAGLAEEIGAHSGQA